MKKSVLFSLVLAILIFGYSLLNIFQYLIGIDHFILTGLVMPIGLLILILVLLRKPLWLMAIAIMEGWLLRSFEQRIQRNSRDTRAYRAKIGILLRFVWYDCERMKYFLVWRTDGVPARDIRPRINKNLGRLKTMLQTLETVSRLNPSGLVTTQSQFTSPMQSRFARDRLEDFKRLFPVEVEKMPFDKPVYCLVVALQTLCAALGFNPLSVEALKSAADLMGYLQREEMAEKFRQIAISLE